MINHTPFTIATSDGETLYCDARLPADADRPLPVVVVVHGFKGFKDWGFFPYVAERLAAEGFYVLSFNFSHNGIEGNSEEFTRLDRFELNTFTREVRELREVVDTVARGYLPHADHASRTSIALLGHSRGGGIVILEAADDPRIGRVVSWAPVASYDRYTERQKGEWRRLGYMESKNMRTGQMMRLGIGLLDDLEQHAAELDVESAARRLRRPLLILHGEQDLSVRIDNGEQLAAAADPSQTEFIPIPRANHTFGAVHPFEESNPILEEAIERTAAFLRDAV